MTLTKAQERTHRRYKNGPPTMYLIRLRFRRYLMSLSPVGVNVLDVSTAQKAKARKFATPADAACHAEDTLRLKADGYTIVPLED